MSSVYPGQRGRKRAIALGAADANALLKSKLPYIYRLLTPAQIGQVQRILDATVVNPVIQKEYADASRKNDAAERARGVFSDGSGAYRTPDSPQMRKLADELIEFRPSDKHILLQHPKLLAHDALKPTTDNPDEAAYLKKVGRALSGEGVYLRIEPAWVRDPDDSSHTIVSQQEFNVWLSLGYDGDAIPTSNGQLSRDNLLDNVTLGAGYYRQVIKGRHQSGFEQAADRLSRIIGNRRDLHSMEESARLKAAPGIAPASDFLGHATYPSQKIWDLPSDLIVKARYRNLGGNIDEAGKLLAYAAIFTDLATQKLYGYIDATTKGAQRAVGALTVIKEMAEIVDTALMVWSIAGVAVRVAASEAVAAGTKAASRKVIDRAVFDKMLQGAEKAGASRLEAGAMEHAAEWTADVSKVFDAAAKRGVELSEKELDSLCKAADAKWGNPGRITFAPSPAAQRTLSNFSNEVSNGTRKYFSH